MQRASSQLLANTQDTNLTANMSGKEHLSLYLHIPFCRHRCSYCDFNTYTTLGGLIDAYVEALCAEIQQVAKQQWPQIKSVYLGGGTPSLLPGSTLGSVLHKVRSCFSLAEHAEISIEANPDTVDLGYLSIVRQSGVNRLSFGAQSAISTELELLHREHDFETVVRAFEIGRVAGFENINLDLIYGVPGQTQKSWETSLQATLDLRPDHLSLYALTIEPGTPMHRWLANGQIPAPNPDMAADQYELACQLLVNAGYDHYEISNWALPKRVCHHNLSYWRNEEYLGLGAGAHGHVNGYRYWLVKQPRVYIRRVRDGANGQFLLLSTISGKQKLSMEESMADTMITQLRLLNEGLDLVAFEKRFGMLPYQAYPGIIEQLIDWDLLREERQHILLTQRGRLLSNQVFYRFMD